MYFLSLDIIRIRWYPESQDDGTISSELTRGTICHISPLYCPLWEALLIFHLARRIPFNTRSLEVSCPTHRSVSPYVHMLDHSPLPSITREVGGWPLTDDSEVRIILMFFLFTYTPISLLFHVYGHYVHFYSFIVFPWTHVCFLTY